jgi:hypothetical protein
MKRLGTFGAALSLLATGAFALACASVLGVDDPILDPPGTDDGGADATADVAPPPDDGGGGPDVVVLVDAGVDCPNEQADDARGIFVSPGGVATSNCGSKLQPCTTLALGLTRAKAVPGITTVYVDSGNYAETVSLAGVGGLLIQGGWDDVGGAWRRQCTTTRAQSAKIVGVGGVGVRAVGMTGLATLDTLSIQVSLAGGTPSQSLYGVFASGATSWVKLVDVGIAVGNAGAGGAGGPGVVGGAGANCVGNGGAAGAAGGTAAPAGAGTFSPTGYAAPAGGPGTGGAAGSGTGGGGAPTVTCITSCTLADGGVACDQTTNDVSGADGTGGCGGGAGAGGGGAAPGGSAIAVYAWDGQVNLVRGAIAAGNGGAGGAGGLGGVGGAGTVGAMGADGTACPTTCTLDVGPACTAAGNVTPRGGSAGRVGGKGGSGGSGAGSAGGFSYAVFTNPNAIVTVDTTTLAHGAAGTGGSGAPSGKSGDTGTLE